MNNSTYINYSILRYYPNIKRNDNIVAGIVIHVPSIPACSFYPTITYDNIKHFDNLIDNEQFTADLQSFNETFNYSSRQLSYFPFTDITDDNFLQMRTEHYSNEYRFDTVNCIHVHKQLINKTINQLLKKWSAL